MIYVHVTKQSTEFELNVTMAHADSLKEAGDILGERLKSSNTVVFRDDEIQVLLAMKNGWIGSYEEVT